MKKFTIVAFLITFITLLTSCSENYSTGERIGYVTKFSEKGIIFKSGEAELNLTQTGMNTSSLFDCSVDNDMPDQERLELSNKLDKAALKGYKVKITYHEVFGWNWFKNRGETDYFISKVEILDTNSVSINTLINRNQPTANDKKSGKNDTVINIQVSYKEAKEAGWLK